MASTTCDQYFLFECTVSLLVYCTSVHTGVRSIIVVRVYETTSTWTQSLPVVRQQYTSKFYMSICEYWKYHSPYTVVMRYVRKLISYVSYTAQYCTNVMYTEIRVHRKCTYIGKLTSTVQFYVSLQ